MRVRGLKSREYYELKNQLNEIQRMVESLYDLFLNNKKSEKPLSPARVYQLDQIARRKAKEIRNKLQLD